MAFCDSCKDYLSIEDTHQFSGYGFYLLYCEDCCPLEVDGYECEKEHPSRNPNEHSEEV